MNSINRMQTEPVKYARSRRQHFLGGITSLPAGKMVPVKAVPILREDSLVAKVAISCEMLETHEILLNRTNLRVMAYVVPWLAFSRFEGSREQFDRSYMGEPQYEGGDVVDFFELIAAGNDGTNPIWKYLGLHADNGDMVNTMPVEAYNRIWNFRAKNRSPDLAERALTTTSLAPAFWHHSRFQNIVPDFDLAMIDGQVALDLLEARVPVRGIGLFDNHATKYNGAVVNEYGGVTTYTDGYLIEGVDSAVGAGQSHMAVRWADGGPAIFAELQEGGLKVSLSNIQMAKQTQAFAKLRERYEGLPDEYLINMLMAGYTLPEQHLKQPILVGDVTIPFSQIKRYATDAENLAVSATSGGTVADMTIFVPQLSVGGLLMIVAEAVPEQLFERQKDPFFHITNARDGAELRDLPDAVRDTLDPIKVDTVFNGDIDVLHATPTAPFGHEPMNAKWNRFGPTVGGKFFRPTAGTNAARARIWPVEVANPTMSADWFIVSALPSTVFLDEASDPFELTLDGAAALPGNTQFGGVLVEATENYEKVEDMQPVDPEA